MIKISVVIPCFNEKTTIGSLLKKLSSLELNLETEIIVVDDGSNDGSREYLQSLEHSDRMLKCLFHPRNLGKGAALRTGFQAAAGEIIIIQDADLEYDPDEYPRLIKPILDGKADVVYGSRFVGGQSHRVLYFWHSLGNKFLTFVSNIFTNLNLTDMEVCYKVFKRGILDKIVLKENRFGFEPEFTAKISRQGFRIYEVGVSYAGRTYKEGKKINWKDGLRAIYCIVRYSLFK